MEALTNPPAEVQRALSVLRDGLDVDVPAKELDRNLLIGTWNVRAFGDLTEAWATDRGTSPLRNLTDVLAIAEILRRFDVVAIQEARETLKALRWVLKALGPDWGLILTDVTQGDPGNGERLAFVFDTRRVKPSGLAAELVVPKEQLEAGVGPQALREQFARTPYAVSFQAAGQTFILVTLHVLFGRRAAERIPELEAIARWLAGWAGRVEDYNQNLIALGDFNIDRRDDPAFQAFASTGLRPPAELEGLSRTIFDKPTREHFYDQIAWFHDDGRAKLTLDYTGHAGRFEWTRYLYRELEATPKSWHISDHFPLWAEFSIRVPG